MDTKGGRYTVEINGQTFKGRGEASINASRVAVESGTNMDGTSYRTIRGKPASLELTFDRGRRDIVFNEAMMLAEINVTFVEEDIGVTHLFTRGSWIGEGGVLNTATGEVTGLRIETDNYQLA